MTFAVISSEKEERIHHHEVHFHHYMNDNHLGASVVFTNLTVATGAKMFCILAGRHAKWQPKQGPKQE
jgi:hypothetical protein